MALTSDTVELLKTVVGAGSPIDCDMVTFNPEWIYVYYGADRIQAVYNTDYVVTVAADFQSFVLTATASLITKLNNLGEGNDIRVVRFAPNTNAMTETDAFKRVELVQEFDRISMRFMQLQYQFGFIPQDFAATVQSALDAVVTATAQAVISTSGAATATAQAVISTTQANTATTQANTATTQAGNAATNAANAASSAATAQTALDNITALGIFVLSGTGAPSNAIGQNGWYYIDKAASYLYGPKAAGVWPAGVPMTAGGGAGDVFGPAGGTANNEITLFSSTTGKIIKGSGVQISTLAALASPAFTGVPTAPTAAPGTNTTQLSTTAFVKAAIDVVLGGVSAAFDTLAEVETAMNLKAPLASPALTGNPTAPTPATGDNDTSIATTAFVSSQTFAEATSSPAGTVNDSNLTAGLGQDVLITLTPTVSSNFTGVVPNNAKRITILNGTDGTTAAAKLLILPHEAAGSAAANRFSFADRRAHFLFPGESITFVRVNSRWLEMGSRKWNDGFSHYNDTTGSGFYTEIAGTGAGNGSGAGLSGDTTQKPLGVLQIDVGTTSTGASGLGLSTSALIEPAIYSAGFIARVAVDQLSNATNEFSIRAGFHDGISVNADVTNGVYWEYLRTNSTAWNTAAAGGGVRSKAAVGPVVDTNYIELGIFLNGNWSQADFFYSQDGRTYTFVAPVTGANLPVAGEDVGLRTMMKKSAGTASRLMYLDFMGYRYDWYRGSIG